MEVVLKTKETNCTTTVVGYYSKKYRGEKYLNNTSKKVGRGYLKR